MPFWRVYYHLVWTTKNREPFIQPAVEPYLYALLVSKAAELGVYVYAINGWVDHVHLIVAIPPKHAVADVVKRLKGASAHIMNQSGKLDQPFNWQRGYGVLTLGEKQRATAETYVHNQKEHHRQRTTNSWLERVDEQDEGPADVGLKPDKRPVILQENRPVYLTINEHDFPF